MKFRLMSTSGMNQKQLLEIVSNAGFKGELKTTKSLWNDEIYVYFNSIEDICRFIKMLESKNIVSSDGGIVVYSDHYDDDVEWVVEIYSGIM